MDRNDVIYLVSESFEKNKYGVPVPATSERMVFCRVDSVTRSEFFEGGRNGLNPEFRFIVFAHDYHGEAVVKYKGRTYGVYRTYLGEEDNIELYAERKGGINGIDKPRAAASTASEDPVTVSG
jgi:SPP1 family predicted phage head-tail adaptor